MTTQKSRKINQGSNKQQTDKETSYLASAVIEHGRDTDILQEDLVREFNPDLYTTDDSYLINQEWVRFFNTKSSTLKSLMALVNNSTTLRNIINQKTTLSLGDGFVPYESKSIPILQTVRKLIKKLIATDDSIEQLNELLFNVNLNNETLEDVMYKAFFDYWAFGNAIVEFVKGTRDGKKVVMIYHIPLTKVAIKKVDESNIVKYIGVSDYWDNGNAVPKDQIAQYPIYPNFERVGKAERSVIHLKAYSPGFMYWGLPSNFCSRFWAELEYRIPKYNITKFKNGFVPSAILQFYGSLTKEEGKKMIDKLKETFTDTGEGSKIFAQVLSDEKYKMNAQILEDKSEGNWLALQDLASQAIVTGNDWTKTLSGFSQAGKLGSNQEKKNDLEVAVNMTIKPVRRKFLQCIINPFVKENALVKNAPDGLKLSIANLNPISFSDKINPNSVLLISEQREMLGFDALDENGINQLNTEKGNVNSNNTNQA